MLRDFVSEFIAEKRKVISESLLADSADAKLLLRFMDEMEEEHERFLNEELPPRQASLESGFTQQSIGNWRRANVIGTTRRDLPRKAGHGVQRAPRISAEPRSIADKVLGRRRVG